MTILKDVRAGQILLMGSLLTIGVFWRDFSIFPLQIILTFVSGFLTQFLFMRIYKVKEVGFLSAFISCLGMCLLLRSDNYWVHPAAAFIAMSSKFLIRFNGKHLFNPTGLAVLVSISILPGSWVSPGQWGQDLAIALWLLAFGFLGIKRARVLDLTWFFLAFYVGLLTWRIVNFGYPWPVLGHQLQNGALILFAFFMISDPKTMPNHFWGRILHAALVAFFAYYWQFKMFKYNGLLWGVILCAPMVIFWDYMFKARLYQWNQYSKIKKVTA